MFADNFNLLSPVNLQFACKIPIYHEDAMSVWLYHLRNSPITIIDWIFFVRNSFFYFFSQLDELKLKDREISSLKNQRKKKPNEAQVSVRKISIHGAYNICPFTFIHNAIISRCSLTTFLMLHLLRKTCRAALFSYQKFENFKFFCLFAALKRERSMHKRHSKHR